MSVNDSLGILIGFAVIGGIILGEIRSRQKQPIQPEKNTKIHKELREEPALLDIEDSEFDGALLFGDFWFPAEFPELGENN